MSNGYINYKWPFPIAMLNYQRVDSLLYDNDVILLFLNQRQTWVKSALKAVKTKKDSKPSKVILNINIQYRYKVGPPR